MEKGGRQYSSEGIEFPGIMVEDARMRAMPQQPGTAGRYLRHAVNRILVGRLHQWINKNVGEALAL